MAKKTAKVICFANKKGGVGKSTLATLFANYITTHTKLKVCIVDCDDMDNTIHDRREDELKSIKGEENNLYDIMVSVSSDFPSLLKDFLINEYDIVIADMPGNLAQAGVLKSYVFMDVIFIPSNVTAPDLKSTKQFAELIDQKVVSARKKAGFKTTVRGIKSRVNRRILEYKNFDGSFVTPDGTKEDLGVSFLKNDLEHNDKTFGVGFTTLDKYTNYKGQDYHQLCKEILENIIK